MKITGTSSYLKVYIMGRVVKIQGEAIIGGFVAYVNTIKNWEPPYANEPINEETKQQLIEAIEEEARRNNYRITFE